MTRAELYAVLDRFLAALNARDPHALDWAPGAHHSENNVMLEIGDGVWGTIDRLGDYQLRFADVKTGQVGYFGTVHEAIEESAFSLRLKVNEQGQVCESEMVVVRQSDSGIKFENCRYWDKPILNANVEAQVSRDEMIRLSNGYFDTLQLNYRYDTRLRARRFPLIDEERGIVLAAGFIDHAGALAEYKLTDGTLVKSPLNRPHSFYLFEAFKFKDGAIEQIEANFITVPYNMPSPWDDWQR